MDILKKPVSECAFHNKEGAHSGVCSGSGGVDAMKKILNELNVVHSGNTDKDILKKTQEKLACDSESCVVKSAIFKKAYTSSVDKLKKEKFKPDGPWKDDTWLNNFNIDDVLDQWTNVYPGFVHIPFQMRDFDKKNTELAKVDLYTKYKEGMKSFGVVLNTDYSSGGGIHWFAIYGDFSDPNNVTLEYFNSSGTLPLKEVQNWLYSTKALLESHDLKVKVIIVSRIEHQKSDTECGVFSLWYIWSRLNGISYVYFDKSKAVTDDMMYTFRRHLYRRYK